MISKDMADHQDSLLLRRQPDEFLAVPHLHGQRLFDEHILSGFESGLSGWNISGSDPGVTLTQVAGGHSGSFAARLANPGTVAATYALNDSPNWANSTTAGTYTGSLWVRSDTPGASLKLRFREYMGSTLAGTATSSVTLTSTWQQVTVTYSPVSPGSSTLDFNAYVAKGAAGTSFDADDASITRG